MRQTPKKLLGNASGGKTVLYIVLVSVFSAAFFIGSYMVGNLFIAKNLLPQNTDFSTANVEIVTLSQYSSTNPEGLERDLTPLEVSRLQAKAVEIGKKLNFHYLGVVLVNDKCSPADSDYHCEVTLTEYNDEILDSKLGTTAYDRKTCPDGLVIVMDIQDPVPFTWITSHGSTADGFFTSGVKDEIFEEAKGKVPVSTDRLVYERLNAILDGAIFRLRDFGTFSYGLMLGIFIVSLIAISVFFAIIRSRYSLSKVKGNELRLAGVSIDVSNVEYAVIGTRTAQVYHPPVTVSTGGGGFSGGGGHFSSGGGGFSSGGGGGFSSGGGGGGSSSGGGRG
ncbi:MAG: hypothetical protein LBU38_03900 [Propionibacteriaceae bacterium]|nr:hypothetical protein [Propionibacteriaceae bacterium]